MYHYKPKQHLIIIPKYTELGILKLFSILEHGDLIYQDQLPGFCRMCCQYISSSEIWFLKATDFSKIILTLPKYDTHLWIKINTFRKLA